MTNYDHICNLSPNEMSKLLYSVYLSCCICCNKRGTCSPTDRCREHIEDWLKSEKDHPKTDLHNVPVDDLNLTPRVFECLHQAGITSIGELVNYTAYDLSRIPHLGNKSVVEIICKVKETTGIDLKI